MVDSSDTIDDDGKHCPTCHGIKTHLEVTLRYWKCETCSTIWGVGLNKSYFHPVQYHESNHEKKQEKE